MKARHRILAVIVVTLAGGAMAARGRGDQSVVTPAIDVLLRDSVHLLGGKRVGLITHHAAVDANGASTIDRLSSPPGHAAPGSWRLVALFAPEHGLRGAAAPGEAVGDSVDRSTGIPIYSLYDSSRAPTPAELDSIDVLLVDLQDVGVRTFTYISTALLAMRAAKEAEKPVIILDRPNPIGCLMAGPVLDERYASFIGALPVPLRHGMTMGELARFANRETGIRADLTVIPVQGWRRCMWFDETGLPFVPPSPNLPDMDAVAWYPGTVLFEATNLSVGRGTSEPFQQVGAPWFELSRWERLPAYEDTVTFTPRNPGDGKFNGVPLTGVRLRRPTRTTDPIDVAVRLLARVQQAYGDSLVIDSRGLALRLGVGFDDRCPNIQCLPDLSWNQWPADVQVFRARARRYFLYL